MQRTRPALGGSVTGALPGFHDLHDGPGAGANQHQRPGRANPRWLRAGNRFCNQLGHQDGHRGGAVGGGDLTGLSRALIRAHVQFNRPELHYDTGCAASARMAATATVPMRVSSAGSRSLSTSFGVWMVEKLPLVRNTTGTPARAKL